MNTVTNQVIDGIVVHVQQRLRTSEGLAYALTRRDLPKGKEAFYTNGMVFFPMTTQLRERWTQTFPQMICQATSSGSTIGYTARWRVFETEQ